MKLFLITVFMFNVSITVSLALDNDPLNKSDLLRLHMPEFADNNVSIILEIYDNQKLEGKPIFIVDDVKVTDLKAGESITRFDKYYKLTNAFVEDKPSYTVIKTFPYDFIKTSIIGYVVPVESKVGDTLKILDKNLYFKVKFTDPTRKLKDIMEWRNDSSLESARNFVESEIELKVFMDNFLKCINKKDTECLFSLNSGFKAGILFWSSQFQDESCKDNPEIKKILSLKKKYVVDWDMFQEFIKLKNDTINSELAITDFGKEKSLSLDLKKEVVCNSEPSIRVVYRKIENKSASIYIETIPR